MNRTGEHSSPRPLRLWPGIVLVTVQWLAWFALPLFWPAQAGTGMLTGMACGLLIVLWWLFFSRARWGERLGAIALMVLAVMAIQPFLHPSIAGGMMGMMPAIFSLPLLSLALVAWASRSRAVAIWPGLATLAAAFLLSCGLLTLLRTEGMNGDGGSDWAWRWSPTAEERLAAKAAAALQSGAPTASAAAPAGAGPLESTPQAVAVGDAPTEASATAGQVPQGDAGSPGLSPADPSPAASTTLTTEVGAPAIETAVDGSLAGPDSSDVSSSIAAVQEQQWPGFRGGGRDGVVRGLRIATNWSDTPPVEVWRRPIGPAWSSFAVAGSFVYTQEQRGDEEVVACYDLTTGAVVWHHSDPARFWESNAGAGPRATPTLANGRVYTLGATGILNALDARTGARIWSQNPPADTGSELPLWGFSGSPLVLDNLVVVATAGMLAAYDATTGERRWIGPKNGGGGYSSPQLLTTDGVSQILMTGSPGLMSLAPVDGSVLWQHNLPSGTRITQPVATADGDLLVAEGDGQDIHRLSVAHQAGSWTVEERWVSNGLKPYFSDFVVHGGFAYGFDGNMLAAIDVATGKRVWKGGRYGHGQLILLADQDLLLVLAEKGELALVEAKPGQYQELARVPAITGKTWNHPVLVGDLLLVRNSEEMAAFRLPLAEAR